MCKLAHVIRYTVLTAYCNKIFIFAVLERWLIHFNETECSFVYLVSTLVTTYFREK